MYRDQELITEGRLGDLIVVAVLVRKIIKPIQKTDAFNLGLIDAKGKLLKKPGTKEEKNAYTILDKFVFKIKRLLGHKVSAMATFLLLLSDKDFENCEKEYDLLIEEVEQCRNKIQ